MSFLNESTARSIAANVNFPVVFRGYVNNWALCQWSVEKWTEIFGEREIPFRCINKDFESDEPCWERKCKIKNMTFKKFAEAAVTSDEAMYFDYKYLHQWFSEDSELCKEISWNRFGYLDKGPIDTTLWVGNGAAHTPAHQDTYGVNIVTQVHGKKRWILLPPESTEMQPTRVPYEESSVYSELNFYRPIYIDVFKELTGARVVDLSAGDALLVPHKWWHYVQNEDPINISLNMWLPHKEDDASRMCEAAIKAFVAQFCKELPQDIIKLIVNPNESDIASTPDSQLRSLIKTATDQCFDSGIKKLQDSYNVGASADAASSQSNADAEYDLQALLDNPDNKMELPPIVTGQELVKIIEETKKRYDNPSKTTRDDEITPLPLYLAKTEINEFCQSDFVLRLNRLMSWD